ERVQPGPAEPGAEPRSGGRGPDERGSAVWSCTGGHRDAQRSAGRRSPGSRAALPAGRLRRHPELLGRHGPESAHRPGRPFADPRTRPGEPDVAAGRRAAPAGVVGARHAVAGDRRSAHAAGPGAAADSARPGRGDPAEEPPRLTRLSRLRAGRALVRAACGVVAILGVAGLALQLAL